MTSDFVEHWCGSDEESNTCRAILHLLLKADNHTAEISGLDGTGAALITIRVEGQNRNQLDEFGHDFLEIPQAVGRLLHEGYIQQRGSTSLLQLTDSGKKLASAIHAYLQGREGNQSADS